MLSPTYSTTPNVWQQTMQSSIVAIIYPIHSGTIEVIHSKVTLSNDPFVDPTPFRSPFEGSNYNIQEVIAPVLAHKPKRRRSRSTKRSRSTPSKLNEILVEENSYNLTAIPLVKVKSKEKQKIIEKRSYAGKPLFSPAASKYLINPPSHDKEVVTIPILVDGAYSAVSQGLDHNFPIPLGWGAMSNKKRKNHKKMWHNRQVLRFRESLFQYELIPLAEHLFIES
ncbi:hypothetical protein AXX17_ATUG00270 [Arabidopsis thaliana]|uniref:Uncharacterized protein n=1 Tax=Arabidopsis thaliana TaxID=3702 RepID=A0A178U734_ARATH|nr:hypothetical protein AXX17_ATUG00270 [Arabidopsis thaliana]